MATSQSPAVQQSLFPVRRRPDAKVVKALTRTYASVNRECAERFLADPKRYAGIQFEWARLWMENNR